MSNSQAKKKYRPVLSATAIAHIVSLAKSESPISSASIEVIGILAPFLAKIENAGIAEAYEIKPPKMTIEESLGLQAPITTLASKYSPSPDTAYLSKEELWKVCYDKYSLDPISCSVSEIQAAREHMYLNDLMSPEEIEDFEREEKERVRN